MSQFYPRRQPILKARVRYFSGVLFCSLFAWLHLECATSNANEPTVKTADRPNIILCMTDDQGWLDCGFNGNKSIKTPNLDALAGQGIKFNRWYAAAPVCSPTRGSCLTGRHPYRYGIYSANTGHMKPEEIGLQEVLKEQGYATGHFGKWHLGTLTTKIKDANRGKPGATAHYSPPWEHGFDECCSTESKVPTFDPMKNPEAVSGAARKDVPAGGNYGTYYWTGEDKSVPNDELNGDDSMLIVKRATKFIESAVANDKPFFVVIWFHAPHLPVVADKAHRDLYPDHPFGLKGQHYAGCISAIDDSIGTLQSELERLNAFDNTLLWYSSDNGPENSAKKGPGRAEPYRGRKRDLYEGGVRVPGFVVWPAKIKTPSTTDVPGVTSDYFPTVLDLLDIELPARPYDGVSLKPLIDGAMDARNKPIGFQSKNVATWNAERYKLVVQNGKQKSVELFDLVADESETSDISGKHPEIVEQMSKELMEWQESCKRSDQGGDY